MPFGKLTVHVVVHPVEGQRRALAVSSAAMASKVGPAVPLPALTRIGHGAKGGDVDEGQDAGDIGGAGCGDGGDLAAGFSGGEVLAFSAGFDRGKAGVGADGGRSAPDDLHAVVVDGIVRGGDLDPAIGIVVGGGEIHLLGARKAEVEDMHARVGHAPGDGGGESDGGRAAVAADDDGGCFKFLGEGAADAVGNVLVEVQPKATAHVIGLEAGQRHVAHRQARILGGALVGGDQGIDLMVPAEFGFDPVPAEFAHFGAAGGVVEQADDLGGHVGGVVGLGVERGVERGVAALGHVELHDGFREGHVFLNLVHRGLVVHRVHAVGVHADIGGWTGQRTGRRRARGR